MPFGPDFLLCGRICTIGMRFLVFDDTSILDTQLYTHEVSNKDNENSDLMITIPTALLFDGNQYGCRQ